MTRDAALAKIAEIQGSIYPNFVGGADLRMASDVRAEYAHLEAKEHNEVRRDRETWLHTCCFLCCCCNGVY